MPGGSSGEVRLLRRRQKTSLLRRPVKRRESSLPVPLRGRRAAARLKVENPLIAVKSRFFDKIKKLKRSEV